MKSQDAQSTAQVKRGAGLGMRDLAARFLLFAVFWIVLSGKFDAEHVIYGLISIITVLVINRPVWRSPVEVDIDQDRWEFAPTLVHWRKLAAYIPWLIKEVVVANVIVAGLVLNPKRRVAPVLLGFRVGLRSPIARVTLGNSITLTPGTLTLEIQEDWFLVHALDDKTISSLTTGAMQNRVAGVYKYPAGLEGETKVYRSYEDFGK